MDYLRQQIDLLNQKIEENKKLLSDPELAELARLEIIELERQKQEFEKPANVPQESGVNPNIAILEIRSAAGGDEAELFAGDLLRMYLRYAQNNKWRAEELEPFVIKITGKDSFSRLRLESGVHRVQRVPKTESSGRIHTSTATVAVLPQVNPNQFVLNPADIAFEAFRSGGHGGQNVNKVSTAVRLKHIPTGLIVTAQTERFQAANREIAVELMRSRLWQMEEDKRNKEISGNRQSLVGSGDRSEKIRTYNFPQNRITDHRIGKSWHNLEEILEGNLEDIIDALEQANNTIDTPDV